MKKARLGPATYAAPDPIAMAITHAVWYVHKAFGDFRLPTAIDHASVVAGRTTPSPRVGGQSEGGAIDNKHQYAELKNRKPDEPEDSFAFS